MSACYFCGVDHDGDRDAAAAEAHQADGFVRDVSGAHRISIFREDGTRIERDERSVLTLNKSRGRWHWEVVRYELHIWGGTQHHTEGHGSHVLRAEALAEAERWLAGPTLQESKQNGWWTSAEWARGAHEEAYL